MVSVRCKNKTQIWIDKDIRDLIWKIQEYPEKSLSETVRRVFFEAGYYSTIRNKESD